VPALTDSYSAVANFHFRAENSFDGEKFQTAQILAISCQLLFSYRRFPFWGQVRSTRMENFKEESLEFIFMPLLAISFSVEEIFQR